MNKTLRQASFATAPNRSTYQGHEAGQSEALLDGRETCWERHQERRKLINGLEQERLLYEQERGWLWQNLQAEWQVGGEGKRAQAVQEHVQMMQDFNTSLSECRHIFLTTMQAFRERSQALREQLSFLKGLTEHKQERVGFGELLAAYEDMQQDLSSYRQFLRDQQNHYRQQRLDCRAALDSLDTEKISLRQRQEERRWQDYSNIQG